MFLDVMAPLGLEHAAEEISKSQSQTELEQAQNSKDISECRSRALIVSIATGVIGFSAGFAVQVIARKHLFGFVKRYYVIPSLVSAYVSTRTHMHLVENCQTNLVLPKRCILQSDKDSQNDAVALS